MPKTKVFIRENSLLARLAAGKLKSVRVAMVVRRTIHLWGVSVEDFLKDESWVCHELEHVAQYQRLGTLGVSLEVCPGKRTERILQQCAGGGGPKSGAQPGFAATICHSGSVLKPAGRGIPPEKRRKEVLKKSGFSVADPLPAGYLCTLFTKLIKLLP